jgi:hypothetical protein
LGSTSLCTETEAMTQSRIDISMKLDKTSGTQLMPTNEVRDSNSSLMNECKSTPETLSIHDFKEEIGGVSGLEPTRYGDWEKNGRCVDF